jgi:hypothetical protein
VNERKLKRPINQGNTGEQPAFPILTDLNASCPEIAGQGKSPNQQNRQNRLIQ